MRKLRLMNRKRYFPTYTNTLLEDFKMRKLLAMFCAMFMTGSVNLALAGEADRPLPPVPPEVGAPADCDPTMKSSDPNAAVTKDCPTQPEPFGEQTNNKAAREKGKSQTLEPESGGRNVDSK